MSFLTTTYTLSNNVRIPKIGFGTWQVANGDEAYNSVKTALEAGYIHIDTAAAYENEESVGKAIKDSGINRDSLFITTKLANPCHGYEKTHEAFAQSLKALNLDYIDLYLIHWPNPLAFRDCWQEANAGTWKAFEELYTQGKIRALGVSNFRQHHIEALLQTAKIAPMVNQIKFCPGEIQKEVTDYCKNLSMVMEAYSPFGSGLAFKVPEIQEIAKKYNKTVAQLLVRWCLQQDFIPLPKSITKERIIDNTKVDDFSLSSEDILRLNSLTGTCGSARNPDEAPF